LYFEFQIVRQWEKCHFGQSDQQLDIDEDGNRNFETCYCPKRGECESCDLFQVCYPVRSTKLSKCEIGVLRLLVAGFDENQIADTLCNSVNTIKKHRMNMLKRLNLHKTSQLIEYWHNNKLR
jgi:DNA-binding NarL/FixJ family response regulator